MTQYEGFANIYDILMDDVDYEKWVSYVMNIFKYINVQPKSVLDLACGTGNITIPMAKLDYDIWGIDISEQMLSVAENKSRMQGEKIKFIKQDIKNLNLTGSFDAIICACDGINYVLEEDELLSTFQRAYQLLNGGGIFIFDISSYYKLSRIIGNNTFVEEKDGIFYSWENEFDAASSTLTMVLNFFIPEDKLYNRIEEVHVQRAYKNKEVCDNLFKCGFNVLETLDEFTFFKAHEESERVFFISKK